MTNENTYLPGYAGRTNDKKMDSCPHCRKRQRKRGTPEEDRQMMVELQNPNRLTIRFIDKPEAGFYTSAHTN